MGFRSVVTVRFFGRPVTTELLLFVLWLGADVGVFLLGQHFRKRAIYTLDQRLALLKLLVIVDMTPRTAGALMVPISLSVARLGGWWDVPAALLLAASMSIAAAGGALVAPAQSSMPMADASACWIWRC